MKDQPQDDHAIHAFFLQDRADGTKGIGHGIFDRLMAEV
jgi:hypothetical protein